MVLQEALFHIRSNIKLYILTFLNISVCLINNHQKFVFMEHIYTIINICIFCCSYLNYNDAKFIWVQTKAEYEMKHQILSSRVERVRETEKSLNESLTCVACFINAREIFLKDCQHVCLCMDCLSIEYLYHNIYSYLLINLILSQDSRKW